MLRLLRAASALAFLLVPGAAMAQGEPVPATPPATSPAAPEAAPEPPPANTPVTPLVSIGPNDAPEARCEEPPWRFGGTLGVVSLPRFLNAEFIARYKAHWAFGAMVEYLPRGVANFGDVTTVSWFQAGAQGRYFFNKWLFAGLGVGYQFSRAHSEKFGSPVDYVTSGLFAAPRVGVLYTFRNGLALGGDLGATIPILPSEEEISDNGQSDANGRKVSKTFGQFVMPFVSLFRIGYFF